MSKKVDKKLVESIITDADVLAKRHEDFVDLYVTRANEELYQLLSEILAICLKVQADSAKDDIIKIMRKNLRENYNVKTQVNSRLSTIIVRYVIRSNRKTALIYGRIIDIAIAGGITPEALPDCIEKAGGIEAMRKSVVDAETVRQEKFLNTRLNTVFVEYLRRKSPIGEIALFNNSPLISTSDVEFTYLICRNNPETKSLEVVSSIYPCAAIESKALDLFMLNSIAMKKYGTNEFGRFCLDNTLNQDIMLNWMTNNGFSNDEEVSKFYDEIRVYENALPKFEEE